jgi:putative oxidoreductase
MSTTAYQQRESAELSVPGTTLALTVGRIFLALIFILAGFSKIADPTGTAGYMASVGLPSFLLPFAIIVELGGGLLLLVGYQTRIVALVLMAFTLVTALFFHRNFADQNQMIHFLKNLAIAGGFLYVFATGGGRLSIDGWRHSGSR